MSVIQEKTVEEDFSVNMSYNEIDNQIEGDNSETIETKLHKLKILLEDKKTKVLNEHIELHYPFFIAGMSLKGLYLQSWQRI